MCQGMADVRHDQRETREGTSEYPGRPIPGMMFYPHEPGHAAPKSEKVNNESGIDHDWGTQNAQGTR